MQPWYVPRKAVACQKEIKLNYAKWNMLQQAHCLICSIMSVGYETKMRCQAVHGLSLVT